MRSLDFAPLYRSTVGFDRLFDLLEASTARPDWPPYDIEKKGDDHYRITLAVAGFGPNEIDLTQHGNTLLVSGQRASEENGREMLHRGIASRSFKLTFNLADHVRVVGAHLDNGLLSVELQREIPEQMKPRRIEIGAAKTAALAQDNAPAKVAHEAARQVA